MINFICVNCFTDDELIGFIQTRNEISDCDCCGTKKVAVLPFEELLDFFKELFDNIQKSDTGISITSLIQSNWSFFSEIPTGDKIINNALNQLNTIFASSDDLVRFSDEIIENVEYWQKLKEQLKWEKRYLTDINFLTDDLGWDGFFESKTLIEKKDVLYRARLHSTADTNAFLEADMFCPPKHIAGGGRANPSGIPFLYLSDNEETILYEIRASYLDEITVASFGLADNIPDNIVISDFTEVPSLFAPNDVNKRIKATLLKRVISRDLSTPMRRYDSDLDYIPTQFICEFIKVFTNVQGIKFRSSLHNIGNNIVLFDQTQLKCLSVKKVKITKVQITSKDL
jgi:hypothetical protein